MKAAEQTGHAGVWGEEDNKALNSVLQPLRSPPTPQIFGMLGGEARGLICAPKSEVVERTANFYTAINVMAGLVLSAQAGLVTSPLDVANLPEDKQVLGQIYNVLAYMCVSTQICVVMYSTYMLLVLYAHGHSPEMVYRALVYAGTLIGCLELAIYMPLLMWLSLIIISAHIHFTLWVRWICTAAIAIIYLVFHAMFAYYGIRGFPRGMWGWLAATAPFFYCSSRVKTDVEKFSNMYMAAAASGVLAGKDEDHDGIVDDLQASSEPEKRELHAWIDGVLRQPGTQGVRRALLVHALMAEDLTLTRLIKAAKQPGGFKVLMEMFSMAREEERGVQLTRGECLALATAAMEEAERSQARPENGRDAED